MKMFRIECARAAQMDVDNDDETNSVVREIKTCVFLIILFSTFAVFLRRLESAQHPELVEAV